MAKLTSVQRIKKIINWLVFSGIAENQKDIAQRLGYATSSFSQIVTGKVPLANKFIRNLCNLDKRINETWVKTGEGEMLHKQDYMSERRIYSKGTLSRMKKRFYIDKCYEVWWRTAIDANDLEDAILRYKIGDIVKEERLIDTEYSKGGALIIDEERLKTDDDIYLEYTPMDIMYPKQYSLVHHNDPIMDYVNKEDNWTEHMVPYDSEQYLIETSYLQHICDINKLFLQPQNTNQE